MANPTAGAPAPATTAGTAPARTAPNHRPTPPRRLAAEPEPITALDLLARMNSIAVHWWSLIDDVLSREGLRATSQDPLPEWASKTLRDQGRHRLAFEELAQQQNNLRELLRLADGQAPFRRYEIWSKNGSRLSIRLESVYEASMLMKAWENSPTHKGAHIVEVNIGRFNSLAADPALLDTLIGKVRMAGGVFPIDEHEARLEIQDETGRTVTLPASYLRGHPICDQVTNHAQMMSWLEEDEDRAKRCTAAKGTP